MGKANPCAIGNFLEAVDTPENCIDNKDILSNLYRFKYNKIVKACATLLIDVAQIQQALASTIARQCEFFRALYKCQNNI